MYTKLLLVFLFMLNLSGFSQKMDNDKLEKILTEVSDSINGYTGYWEVVHKNRQLLCVTDETNNRMRLIAPIIQTSALDKELLLDALTANFHSALDVKYAISKGILWSAYIHPLKELSEYELKSALDQVVNAANTFGTTFSSTEMIFGGGKPDEGNSAPIEETPAIQKL